MHSLLPRAGPALVFLTAFVLFLLVAMGNTSDHSSFSSRFYLVRVDLSQVTDLIGLEELNVHSYYQIGLWNYCTSTEINSSFLRGIVFCSKRETPFRGLPKILDAINFGIIGEWRDKLKTATYAIFFLLMVAIANALIACPLHIFSHKSRVIAIAATAIAVLTALTSVATAVLVTVTYTTVADKINSSGHLIHAQKGTADFACLWFASVLCILGAITSSFSYIIRHND